MAEYVKKPLFWSMLAILIMLIIIFSVNDNQPTENTGGGGSPGALAEGCLLSSNNQTQVCVNDDLLNITVDNATQAWSQNNEWHYENRTVYDFGRTHHDEILVGSWDIIGNLFQSVAAPARIDGAEGIELLENSQTAAWVSDDQTVVNEEFRVNSSGTTASIIIQPTGGTHDGRLLFYNDYGSEWYAIMDDSVGDCLVIGTGSNPALNIYLMFCPTGAVRAEQDWTFINEATFIDGLITSKSMYRSSIDELTKNSNTPDPSKGGNRITTNCPAGGCSITSFPNVKSGAKFDIQCTDGTSFTNNTNLLLFRASSPKTISSYTCAPEFEVITCIAWTNWVSCKVPG